MDVLKEGFSLVKEDIATALDSALFDAESELFQERKELLAFAENYFKKATDVEQMFNARQNFFRQLNSAGSGTAYAMQDMEDLSRVDNLVQDLTKLYIWCINFLQKIKLFDPEAKIVVYSSSGMRQEFPYDISLINARWKREKEGQVAISLKRVSQLKEEDQERMKKIREVTNLKKQLKIDFKNFSALITSTYKGSAVVTDENGNQKTVQRLPLGGYIAEAFERHYQQQLAIHDMENFVASPTPDINHYGGWDAAWQLIRDSMGGAPGYQKPDVGSSQVKNSKATFFSISSLAPLLTFIENLPKFNAEQIMEVFSKEDTTKFNRAMFEEINKNLGQLHGQSLMDFDDFMK